MAPCRSRRGLIAQLSVPRAVGFVGWTRGRPARAASRGRKRSQAGAKGGAGPGRPGPRPPPSSQPGVGSRARQEVRNAGGTGLCPAVSREPEPVSPIRAGGSLAGPQPLLPRGTGARPPPTAALPRAAHADSWTVPAGPSEGFGRPRWWRSGTEGRPVPRTPSGRRSGAVSGAARRPRASRRFPPPPPPPPPLRPPRSWRRRSGRRPRKARRTGEGAAARAPRAVPVPVAVCRWTRPLSPCT